MVHITEVELLNLAGPGILNACASRLRDTHFRKCNFIADDWRVEETAAISSTLVAGTRPPTPRWQAEREAEQMSSRDEIRRNERTIDVDEACDARLRFIGEIRTPWTNRDACPRQGSYDGPECRLVVAPIWRPALEGLEANQKIEVLYWLDRSRRDLIAQSPRDDGRTLGTFALRSPNRPNPIGTSLVQLVGVADGVVTVRGLDCVDRTPLLDIKPHRCPHGGKAG